MKYLKILIIMIFAVATSACNRDEIFEREQYKHVISLMGVNENAFNIFSEEHDPANGDTDGYTDGYIAASVGGTELTTEAITIDMVEDAALLDLYNKNNFAMESYRYAHYLPASRYSIERHVIIIPAGERRGKMKIRLNADGLSPDSAYFIPLRVKKCSAYEVKTSKSTVLYRVHLKNFWASTTLYNMQYTHRGLRYELGSEIPTTTMMTKHLHPLSGNEVRVFAGNTTAFEQKFELIEAWAIRLAMDDDGNVTINPYGKSRFAMDVRQVDGDEDYPNVFKLIDDGWGNIFKTFLLCYEYVDPNSNTAYLMKEELSIEYVKTVK